MIVEGKKLTAFDAMEAVMNLSDMYEANNSKKTVSFRFSGTLNTMEFYFSEWGLFDLTTNSHFYVHLDNMTSGDNFLDVFEVIQKEMDEMAKIEKEREQCNSEL